MMALAAAGSAQTLTPLISTVPMSGRSRPVIMDRDVVFPAPFGPTRPARDPRPMSRSIPATASLRPKLLRSPRTEIAGWAAACPVSVCPALAGSAIRLAFRIGEPGRSLVPRARSGEAARRRNADAA